MKSRRTLFNWRNSTVLNNLPKSLDYIFLSSPGYYNSARLMRGHGFCSSSLQSVSQSVSASYLSWDVWSEDRWNSSLQLWMSVRLSHLVGYTCPPSLHWHLLLRVSKDIWKQQHQSIELFCLQPLLCLQQERNAEIKIFWELRTTPRKQLWEKHFKHLSLRILLNISGKFLEYYVILFKYLLLLLLTFSIIQLFFKRL